MTNHNVNVYCTYVAQEFPELLTLWLRVGLPILIPFEGGDVAMEVSMVLLWSSVLLAHQMSRHLLCMCSVCGRYLSVVFALMCINYGVQRLKIDTEVSVLPKSSSAFSFCPG